LSFLPPGGAAAATRDEIPTSLTVRPLLCPSEPNPAPRSTVAAAAGGPTTPTSFTAPRRGDTPSKLFPIRCDVISRILLSVRASHFDFASRGTCRTARETPSVWRDCLRRPSRQRGISCR
jgi:hypothetical protein